MFDMNPDTCTLQNIFAMELHRFQDKIAEIVNCAIKELAIEKVCHSPPSPSTPPTAEIVNRAIKELVIEIVRHIRLTTPLPSLHYLPPPPTTPPERFK